MTQGFSSSPNPLRTVPSHRAADPPHSGPTEFYLLPWITAPWAPLPPGGQGHYVRVTDLVHLNSSVIYCGFVVLCTLNLRLSFPHGVLRGSASSVGSYLLYHRVDNPSESRAYATPHFSPKEDTRAAKPALESPPAAVFRGGQRCELLEDRRLV